MAQSKKGSETSRSTRPKSVQKARTASASPKKNKTAATDATLDATSDDSVADPSASELLDRTKNKRNLATKVMLRILSGALLCVCFIRSSSGIATPKCKEPALRKEWRALGYDGQKDLIDAIKASATPGLPPILTNSSLYDDVVYVHMDATNSAHFTGRFLPWHRLYLHTMEGLLRHKCGYKGYMAYWDWTIDSHDIKHSPVFNADPGVSFRTFPNASTNFELSNGAFRDIIRAYPVAHHIQRNYTLRPWETSFFPWPFNMPEKEANATQTTADLEGMHPAAHISLGGDIQNLTHSPNDPIFFLLHRQLDHAWAAWQAYDQRNRKAIAGGINPDLNNFNAHPLGIGTLVTKDMVIYMAGIGPDALDSSLKTATSELRTLLKRFANGQSMVIIFDAANTLIDDANKDEESLNSYVRKVGYIPIPRVEYTDDAIDLVVENLTLSGRNLFPNVVEAHNFVEFSPYFAITNEHHHVFALTFGQMQADMRDFAFYFRKNTGLKMSDSGLADVVLGGEGLTATVHLVSANKDESSVFKVKSIVVKVDTLKFSVRDSKHDLLYKTLRPLATALVKKQIQKAIKDSISTGMEYVGVRDRLASTKATEGEHQEIVEAPV
ncbi:hypothetical protein PILCRDRAFT_9478 [Piloderma croceum F 1598]|uniref:Tyrosinase copper-binding domain-containing protein n=1 Tax=Piloderma croceum (strain F 1598) TaxID=765440 RepID=A0A0C3F7Q7_PILCF|nr:hypothetical protein PILCRDRAFT_9478 [Piloderma croceum F 1598]